MSNYDFDSEMVTLYTQLMKSPLKGTNIWEEINKGNLACVPSSVGKEYDNSNLRLLYVGRAINGWERDFTAATSDEMTEQILKQHVTIHDDIVNRSGFKSVGAKRAYYHKNYNFWRLLRFILAQSGDAIGGDSDWFQDANASKWNQKFVWSNLYKVAPKAGKNPDSATKKAQIEICMDILQKELEPYKPQLSLFVTGDDWFSSSWKGMKSFQNIPNLRYEKVMDKPYIEGIGICNDTRIVVCKRPDPFGKTIQFAAQMAKEIYRAYLDINENNH